MNRATQRPSPNVRDTYFAKLGEGPQHVVDKAACDQTRTCFPRPHAPQPLQAVPSDNAVVVVGAIGIADSATIAHHLVQYLPNRFRDHHIRRDGQQSRRKSRHERAEMNIAGEHHMRRTHPTCRRHNALAHASRIQRDRG